MIELRSVSVSFDTQKVLDNVTFAMKRGELVYLVGQTGAGKSSLLRMMYMDLLPDSGQVRVAGFDSREISNRQIPHLRRRIGIVFQDFRLLLYGCAVQVLPFQSIVCLSYRYT